MKWIKGFLIFGMVMLAHTTISINDVAAKSAKADKKDKKSNKAAKNDKATKAPKAEKGKKDKKGATADKTAAKGKDAKPEKKSLFSSFTSGLKKIGSKVASGAKAAGSKIAAGPKAAKDKASSAAACRAGKGEAPGAKLYAMAASGTALTDAHIVVAHTTPAKVGRQK